MVDAFWATHLSYVEAAKKLGCTKQNVFQQAKKFGKIERDADGKPGVPMEWVNKKLEMRGRDCDEVQS